MTLLSTIPVVYRCHVDHNYLNSCVHVFGANFHLVQTSIMRPLLALCWLARANKQHCSGNLAAAIVGLTIQTTIGVRFLQ